MANSKEIKNVPGVKFFSRRAVDAIDNLLRSLQQEANHWLEKYHGKIVVIRCEHCVHATNSLSEAVATLLVHYNHAPGFEGS